MIKLLTIGLISLASLNAHGAVFYTSEASFLTSAGSTTLESFENTPGGSSTNMNFGTVGVSCTGTTYCPGFFGRSTSYGVTNGAYSVFFATPDTITFTFSSAINSFGIDVTDLGTTGVTDLTLSTSNNASQVLFSGYSAATLNQLFAGVTDSTPFTSVTFSATASGDGIYFDSAQYATNSSIPEPMILSLMGIGLAGLRFSRRRKA